jgi:hypothetical protein
LRPSCTHVSSPALQHPAAGRSTTEVALSTAAPALSRGKRPVRVHRVQPTAACTTTTTMNEMAMAPPCSSHRSIAWQRDQHVISIQVSDDHVLMSHAHGQSIGSTDSITTQRVHYRIVPFRLLERRSNLYSISLLRITHLSQAPATPIRTTLACTPQRSAGQPRTKHLAKTNRVVSLQPIEHVKVNLGVFIKKIERCAQCSLQDGRGRQPHLHSRIVHANSAHHNRCAR